ncbi:MAG: hypothetical protein FWG33_02475, partial [Oscillospiraceae bacterium]|nr:hypothetical protein [Oscillospiraceae bacterium]
IRKTTEDITMTNNHADIICDCFCDMISNITNVDKDSIIKAKEHNKTSNNFITIKHTFTHIIKGYVIFNFSFPFINKLIYGLVDIPHKENKIGDFEETFLLQISTMAVENVYRNLYVDEYEVHEAEIFITDESEANPKEKISFDTGIGVVEVGFSIT